MDVTQDPRVSCRIHLPASTLVRTSRPFLAFNAPSCCLRSFRRGFFSPLVQRRNVMGPSLSSLLSQSATPDLKYCRAQDLAARLFSETVKYEGCKICTDPKSAIYKMWVRNDQDCNTAQINPTRYWPGDRGCPPEASEIEFCALTRVISSKKVNSRKGSGHAT